MTWLVGIGLHLQASFLGEDVHVADHISMTLIYGVRLAPLFHDARNLCVCVLGMDGCGETWHSVNRSQSHLSLPLCMHNLLPSLICNFALHTLLWLMPFPTPGLFSSCPCKLYPSFKILLHKAVPAPSAGRNPFLTLHLLPLSYLVSLSSLMSLGLFPFPDWAVNSFRTRSYSVHQCVLCTTLLYLN